MKLHLTRMAIAAAIASLVSSCTRSDVQPTPGTGDDGENVAAVIHAGIGTSQQTRVHDAQWDENDAIGLAMLVDGGTEIIQDVYNYHYFTSAQLGVFEPQDASMMIYFPADGSLVTFRAYYPYYSQMDENMLIPVNVASQNNLPAIDLMSADHISGNSKRDPIVRLYFHHRLSKLIFKLSAGDGPNIPPLDQATVTIRGMETTGTYHLLQEQLEVDGDSGENITFPLRDDASERYGIVLPREAGEGVEFDITFPDGSEYTAKMSDNLELLGGYQYTFYINLKETPATVSAEIAPWIEAPARYFDSVQASVDAGESVNVDPGTVMDVFISEDNQDYGELTSFEYNTDKKWYPAQDVYWESIPYSPAYMRSSIVMADPLNNTQTGDWLTSAVLTVPRNTGANFKLTRAVSKVFVTLTSDLFTEEELNSATITLPDYLTGGYLADGEFIPGDTRDDILLVDDPGTGTREAVSGTSVALLQPQTVSAGAVIASITINGRTYDVEAPTGGFDFEAGVASQLLVSVKQVGISVSATIVDWELGPLTSFDAVRVGEVAGPSHGVEPGDKIDLYMIEGTDWNFFTSYVYNADGNWYGSPIKYWEDISQDPAHFIARMDAAPALNDSQLPDVLLSEATAGYSDRGVDFVLEHAATKVIVGLNSETFTDKEMAGATIILPDYTTGGSFVGSALVPGNSTGDITLARTDDISGVAIFEPQHIDEDQPAVRVLYGGNTYIAYAQEGGIDFQAGVATTLMVRIEKGGVSISVDVTDWEKNTIKLEALKVTVEAGATTGVKEGEVMEVFAGAQRDSLNTYKYVQGNWTAEKGIYWENLGAQETFWASILRQPAYNSTMPDDYLLSGATTVDSPQAVNFELRHAVAQIAVKLISSDNTVSKAELDAMEIILPDYDTGGTYNNGVFTPGNIPGDVIVQKGVGADNESALAFVEPQTIVKGDRVAVVYDPSNPNFSYTVIHSADIVYRAGYFTTLEIDIRETAVIISAKVIDWIDEPTVKMVPDPIHISGDLETTDGFFVGKTIYVYNMSDQTKRYPYSFQDGVWTGPNLYWDDYLTSGLNLAAVYYPYNDYIPANLDGQTSFPWNIEADQHDGWDRRDLLMDYIAMAPNVHSYFNFEFQHVLARVRVRLRSSEFTDADLAGATVTLNNFVLNGSANLNTGYVDPSTATVASIIPYTDQDGREYSAIVMPQKIDSGETVVTVKLTGYPDREFYGKLTSDLTFPQGYITTLDVDLQRTKIELSATLEEWIDEGGGSIIIN